MITDWRGERRIGREPLSERSRPTWRGLVQAFAGATILAAFAVVAPLAVELQFQFDQLRSIDLEQLVRHAVRTWAFMMGLSSIAVATIVVRTSLTAAVLVVLIGLLCACAVGVAASTHILVTSEQTALPPRGLVTS